LRPSDYRPLSRIGMGSKYLIHTTSNAAGLGIGSVLDDAADRLDGSIGGLRGTLVYQKQRRITPQGTPAVVQQIVCSLNLYDIAIREQQINNWRIGVNAPQLQLPAPAEPVVIGEEEEFEAEEVPENVNTAPQSDSGVSTPAQEDESAGNKAAAPAVSTTATTPEQVEEIFGEDGDHETYATPEQVQEIARLARLLNVDTQKICDRYRVGSFNELTPEEAQKAIGALLNTAKARKVQV